MTESRKAATRPVGNVRIQRDGSIVAESTLSPESFVVGAEVWIPPRKVIPIVFVPGIMGSNLKVKPGSEALVRKRMGVPSGSTIPDSWRPPNGLAESGIAVKTWNRRSPKVRQALLSGDTTVVDDSGFLATQVEGMLLSDLTSLNDEEARFRGWGTVHWDSYGEYLLYLERELRNLQSPCLFMNPRTPIAALDDPVLHAFAEWWPLLHAGDSEKSKAPAEFKVTKDDLKKMSSYWFPVYACGYNWINSSAASGQHVLDTLEKIIQVYTSLKGPSGKQLFQCAKVILVTHSMGGLVGRWAAKHDEKQRILGVVHAVQPATGAPLAYRRTAAGTEPGDISLSGLKQDGFATIIGKTQVETTPVMCNSAGALELLPTKSYPKGWLRLERMIPGANGYAPKLIAALPQSDPYREIYREKECWWRMADPSLLDPAKRFIGKWLDPWEKGYLTFLKEAEKFHDDLGDYYHPHTYVCYGSDPGHLSFGTVRWRIWISERPGETPLREDEVRTCLSVPHEDPPGNFKRVESTELTQWTGKRFSRPPGAGLGRAEQMRDSGQAIIQSQDASGDGTVPWQSGEAPGKAIPKGRTFAIGGYDHQNCYDHERVRQFSLWALTRLVQGAP